MSKCKQGISGRTVAILPDEILVTQIISRVVTQEEGDLMLCRLACVCKRFNDIANHPEILKMVKASCTDLLSNSEKFYQDFIWRCTTMGNIYAIAAVEFKYGCTNTEVPLLIPERMVGGYLLAMTLFDSESIRQGVLDFFMDDNVLL